MAVRKHGTLVANTVATVTLTGSGDVEVTNRGSVDLFFTVGDAKGNITTPTVAGDDNFVVPAGGFLVVDNNDRDGSVVIKLISSGTPDYSVALIEAS